MMYFTNLIRFAVACFVALILFGCDGQVREAEKLGFSNVEEMKKAHALGWHTKKKYYEDNPALKMMEEQERAKLVAKSAPKESGVSKNTGSLEILLAKRESQRGSPICNWLWEIKNNSDINFTDLAVNMVLRDSSGNIVDKTLFRAKVAPNGSAVTDRLLRNCPDIKSIEYVDIDSTSKVDGDYPKEPLKSRAFLLPIKSASNVADVRVKSAGGEFSAPQTSAQSPSAARDKNKLLDADAESCSKVSGITMGYSKKIAAQFSISVSAIRFLGMNASSTCVADIDTPTGPKKCGIGGVILFPDGDYVGTEYISIDGKPRGETRCL